MATAGKAKPVGRGVFADQLRRAAAQRGSLDPQWRALSDHWTLMLQRMYPVWALIGPGLAEPAHIEIHSRTVYLDADELLGGENALAAGLDARAILRCFGAALHEVLHAKHTKRWVLEHDLELGQGDAGQRQLAADRRLLEEPRMEATGLRELGEQTVRGRFARSAIAVAVGEVILPRLTMSLLAGEPTRDQCAHAATYLRARTHYHLIDPKALGGLEPIWARVLGAADLKALDDLYAKVIWIPDGETEPMDRAAERYREIVGEPDPPPSGSASNGADQSDGGDNDDDAGQSAGAGQGDPTGKTVGKEDLKDAIEKAGEQVVAGELAQYEVDIDLQAVIDAADPANTPAPTAGGARGTGAPGGRMPDRGVDRAPYPDERAGARKYAGALSRARAVGVRSIDKRTPGGRFDARAHNRGQAARKRGMPAPPAWRAQRNIKAPIEEPHVALIVDNSGSMYPYEHALGPICWMLSIGLAAIGGRLAIALFGASAELLTDGSAPLTQVPGIHAGGGTAFAGDALEMCACHLELDNQRRPRFVYVVSDGGWMDTHAGSKKIEALETLGCPTIHISIGIEPLAVKASRVVVIDDPAECFDVVAQDTVEALRQTRGRR